ncbi:hypothetical protein HDU76_005100, partial [Blyttiomyces sp. JEL0837]
LLPKHEHDIEDIHEYVRHHLAKRLSVDGELDKKKLNQLVKNVAIESGGVFSYARLACDSLTQLSYKSWDEVLRVASDFDGGLDEIYSRVLNEAFKDADDAVFKRFRKVMGVVVTAREPLCQHSIGRLVGLTVAEVGGIILRIQSILDITNGAVKVLHKSLNDFLSSVDRCKTTEFCIDITSFHSIMANSSLQIMTSDLFRNMANLADHTSQISTSATSKSLLHWIESLVLVGGLTEDIPNQMTRVATWISQNNQAATNIELNTSSRDSLLDTVGNEFNFHTELLIVLAKIDGNYSKVNNDQSLQEALQVTRFFSVLNLSSKPTDGIHDKSESSPSNSARKHKYDVMLSYSWNDRDLILKIKPALESRGLRVFFRDPMTTTPNMYQRMAYGVQNSLTILPLFTVSYGRMTNCKREFMYAVNLNKNIIPMRVLKPSEQLHAWLQMVPARTTKYNLSDSLDDDTEFAKTMDSLFSGIVASSKDLESLSRETSTVSSADGVVYEPLKDDTVKLSKPAGKSYDFFNITATNEKVDYTLDFQSPSLNDFNKKTNTVIVEDVVSIPKENPSSYSVRVDHAASQQRIIPKQTNTVIVEDVVSIPKENPSSYSVRVDHAASQQRIKIDVDSTSTLKGFLDEIAGVMNLDPSCIALFYVEDGLRVKVKGDRSFREALAQTNIFIAEEVVSVPEEGEAAKQAPILIKVAYDSIIYAVEIKSPSLDEFNKQLCKQFAWNEKDLASMQLVHETTVVGSPEYFERTVNSSRASNQYTTLVLQPKNMPAKPTPDVVPSTLLKNNENAKDSFDVMLSYNWQDKDLVSKVKEEFKLRGLRVWFDEEKMDGNMFDRLVEGIHNSSVIIPFLTVVYSKSVNCKRELSYAADLKKTIIPITALKPREELERWALLLTAGLKSYDFSGALDDNVKFATIFDSLYSQTRESIEMNVDPHEITPMHPLRKWLQPVEFNNDLVKFKNDYVPGTRKWAVEDVHKWLKDGLNSLLCLNGGAGVGKSIIAFLVLENLPFGFSLGSAFFCKHDDVNKNNAERIIATIAFDLASQLPDYNEFLMKEMLIDDQKVAKGDTSILAKPSIAFKELFVKGLQDIKPPSSHFVIIIDALDEVGKQGDPVRQEFLSLIRYQVAKLPNWIRVFTTSRPEMDIYQAMQGFPSSNLSPEDKNNIDDILVFVRNQLSRCLSVDEKLNQDTMDELVSKIANEAGGVFEYSRIACNLLIGRSYESWDEVLKVANEFTGGLDQVYTRVLAEAYNSADEAGLDRFRKVIGVVITADEPLNQESIARLVSLTAVEVGGVILRVRSILTISNGMIKVLHKSLKVFLSSPQRCKDTNFCVDTLTFHTIMANSSLQITNSDLFRNMANLDEKANTFSPSATSNVISPCLTYCCKHWMSHLLVTKDSFLLRSVNVFCSKSLRHWIEALVLLGCLTDDMISQMTMVASWISECGDQEDSVYTNNTSQELLQDAASWLSKFKTQILKNPLLVYDTVTVDHVALNKRTWIIADKDLTLKEFRTKIASEFDIDTENLWVFSKENVADEINEDVSLTQALQATKYFTV